MKYTKIVATVNASNCTEDLLRGLYKNGMDVVRINTAHATIEDMDKIVPLVRKVSEKLAIMIDTKGPNIRTSNIEIPIELNSGDEVLVTGENVPQSEAIQINYTRFVSEVRVGQRIIIDDNAMELLIIDKNAHHVVCKALRDGVVKNKKSINVPDAELKTPALTPKDRQFIDYAIKNDIAFIAHSFVRNGNDVLAVKSILETSASQIKIIAKIENRQGVQNINEILKIADGIMVARGDLGIEIPLEEVPLVQKSLIRACMKCGKSVITATQMLQSMENNPFPTRAEVNDVANAVYDGTDAVMLSGETAQGKYPIEAVNVMSRILEQTEKSPLHYFTRITEVPEELFAPKTRFMIHTAFEAAKSLPVKAIVCHTSSGETPRLCATLRPRTIIYAFSYDPQTARQLALTYGVYAIIHDYVEDPQELASISANLLIKQGYLQEDDEIVLLAKNLNTRRFNNVFCLAQLKELLRR